MHGYAYMYAWVYLFMQVWIYVTRECASRVLIFALLSQDYCTYREHPYCRICGNVSGDEREVQIEKFMSDDSDKLLFLLSTRAGEEYSQQKSHTSSNTHRKHRPAKIKVIVFYVSFPIFHAEAIESLYVVYVTSLNTCTQRSWLNTLSWLNTCTQRLNTTIKL